MSVVFEIPRIHLERSGILSSQKYAVKSVRLDWDQVVLAFYVFMKVVGGYLENQALPELANIFKKAQELIFL